MTVNPGAVDRGLIVAAGLLSLVPFLGQTRELASHELMHAEIAREIAVSGDVLRPTLFGAPYTYKTPVMHAAVAGLFRLTGDPSLLLARVPSVAAAILGALALYGIGLVLADRRAARLAALALLGVQGYAHMARVARPDMIFTAAILIACLALAHAMQGGPRRTAWVALAGAAAGFAVVTKGPLGAAFPLCFAVLVPLVRHDLAPLRWSEWGLAGAVLATAFALWAVPAYVRDPSYWLAVVTGPDLRSQGPQARPVHWYVARVLPALLPLTLLLPLVLRDLWRHGVSAPVAVAVAMFCLLSLFGKKRAHYTLPLLPFVALAVAESIVRRAERPAVVRAATALVAASLVAAPVYYGVDLSRWFGAEEPTLAVARRMQAELPAAAAVVGPEEVCEALAFIGRRTNVAQMKRPSDLVGQVRDAGPGTYVVLPERRRAAVLAEVGTRLVLAEVFRIDLPRRGTMRTWRVYRVDAVAALALAEPQPER